MMPVVVAVSALATLCMAGPAAAPAKPHPCAELETALPHGIRLLEAKNHRAFLEDFCPPEVLEEMVQRDGGMDRVVNNFAKHSAGILLLVLKSVQTQQPSMSGDGDTATYTVTVEESPRDELQFIRIDGRWYIDN